jgi:hypothetical protein
MKIKIAVAASVPAADAGTGVLPITGPAVLVMVMVGLTLAVTGGFVLYRPRRRRRAGSG